MTRHPIVALALVWFAANTTAALATPMRFWLSTSNSAPSGPEAPVITGVEGATRRLFIWAQPATQNVANPYDVTTNRFEKLQNFSLNLVASDPIIDFVDGTFEIFNPMLDGSARFEYVFDSLQPVEEGGPLKSVSSEAEVIAGTSDEIIGLQAFSFSTADFAGLGQSPIPPPDACHPADAFCAMTSNGSPAWLVGEVSFKTLASAGTASLFLEIGKNGMTYMGEAGQAPAVTFGVNSLGPSPIYDASVVAQREVTLPLDDADATIIAVAALEGDFNGDALVDAADYVVWRNGLGTSHTPEQLNLWRANFGASAGDGASVASSVPEPSASALFVCGALLTLAFRNSVKSFRFPAG